MRGETSFFQEWMIAGEPMPWYPERDVYVPIQAEMNGLKKGETRAAASPSCQLRIKNRSILRAVQEGKLLESIV